MKKMIKFGDIEIEKQTFHQHKESISIKNINTNKITVSNKDSFDKNGFKSFIGYKDAKKIDICVYFDGTKYMSFLRKDDELLERHNEICKKVKNSLKKDFHSEPVYNEKYLKTKIKSYDGKINTSFQNNKIPKEDSQCICLSVVLMNFVFITGKNNYPQVVLEKCKYGVKERKIPKYITDHIEISSDSDRENPNEEKSHEENSGKEKSEEKNFKNTDITHILKLIFKAYEKYFSCFFLFCVYI